MPKMFNEKPQQNFPEERTENNRQTFLVTRKVKKGFVKDHNPKMTTIKIFKKREKNRKQW